MHFHAQVLTEDEQNRIHKMSLRILEQVGIRFHGERAPRILQENGIKIDPQDRIAKIPPEYIESGAENRPKSIRFGGTQPGV